MRLEHKLLLSPTSISVGDWIKNPKVPEQAKPKTEGTDYWVEVTKIRIDAENYRIYIHNGEGDEVSSLYHQDSLIEVFYKTIQTVYKLQESDAGEFVYQIDYNRSEFYNQFVKLKELKSRVQIKGYPDIVLSDLFLVRYEPRGRAFREAEIYRVEFGQYKPFDIESIWSIDQIRKT